MADVGDLTSQVEVHQLEDVLPPPPLQLVEEPHQLHRREPELRALAAALGPAARALGRQLDPDPRGRSHAHLVGHLEQDVQLVELLQHDHHGVAQLLAHQGQPHVLLVLVAVADDEMPGVLVEAQHRLELGLAPALEANAVGRAELHDLLHHVALLVDLHRVDGGVAPVVPELLDRVGELAREGLDPRLQDVGKAEQQRQAHALGVEIGGEVVEIEPALPVGIRVHGDVAVGVDAEVAEAPSAHVVQLLRVLYGPGGRGDGSGDVELLLRAKGQL